MQMFSAWLAKLRQGNVDAELTAQLAEVTEQVDFLKKGGSLTLTITLAPSGKKDADWIEVVDDVKAKIPQPDRATSIYWPDPEDHTLVRSDPNQQRMFPDAVRGQEGE